MTGHEALDEFIGRMREAFGVLLDDNADHGEDLQFVAICRLPGKGGALASLVRTATEEEAGEQVWELLDATHRAVSRDRQVRS